MLKDNLRESIADIVLQSHSFTVEFGYAGDLWAADAIIKIVKESHEAVKNNTQ